MQQQPLPTPYDITAIPLIPRDPSAFEWGLLLAAFLAALGLIAVWYRLTGAKGLSRVGAQLLREIERLSRDPSNASSERLSRAARRVVEHVTGRDLSGLSGDELSASASTLDKPEERRALRLLGELEAQLYAPPSSAKEARIVEITRDLVPALGAILEQWRVQ